MAVADYGSGEMQAEQAAILPGSAAGQRMAGREPFPARRCSPAQSQQDAATIQGGSLTGEISCLPHVEACLQLRQHV